SGKHVPRSLYINLKPIVIDDSIRNGLYRSLFPLRDPCDWKGGCLATVHSRGHYTIGKEMVDTVMDKARRLADN
ncbi:hypothetical protein GGU10DRAFT_234804, partial [Lentinula aff. detonsa]